jgi:hypothetical protein
MYEAYQRQFQWRADLLLAKRFEDLARQYDLPLSIELEGLEFRVCSHDDLQEHLHRHYVALRERRVTRLCPRVVAFELPQAQLHRVWVTWSDVTERPADARQSHVQYDCRPQEGGFAVSAMRYGTLAMPEFGRRAIHRRLVG